tara:strand:- start:14443 stop:14880 length:438 start_codon:yes stop_codon:yes gene_type:complete
MKKFEFVLYINGNIICQRYFTVRNFKTKSLKSIESQDCLDECVRLIEKDLKGKTYEYLYRSYNPYKKQLQEDIISENIFENEDVFDFEIKTEDRFIGKRRFTGNVYPQRVRYSVDVRKIIPALIKEIQETFSGENFSVEYCGISL